MKIGITCNVIIGKAGLEGYEWIANAGFDCVDFNMQNGFYNAEDKTYPVDFLDIVQRHAEKIRRCGLKIAQTHGPYYFADRQIKNWNDLDIYFKAVEVALAATELLSCDRLVIHPLYCLDWMKNFQGISNIMLSKILIDRICKRINNKVYICIENLPYDFCNNAISHEKFVALGDTNIVKACFDSGHAILREDNPVNHLCSMRDKIYAVHLHDNDGVNDLHNRIDKCKWFWEPIFSELLKNPNIQVASLETSGVYKNCNVKDIPNELIRDYQMMKMLSQEDSKG